MARRALDSRHGWALGALLAGACAGCDGAPLTTVVLDNRFPADAAAPLVVYAAQWQVAFPAPVPPGESSDAQTVVPSSDLPAYAVLAPGWDPQGDAAPSSLVVIESRAGLTAHLDDALHIPVDDATFAGNCAAKSTLPQSEADFITQVVFPGLFGSRRYDAATCTSAVVTDAGGSP